MTTYLLLGAWLIFYGLKVYLIVTTITHHWRAMRRLRRFRRFVELRATALEEKRILEAEQMGRYR